MSWCKLITDTGLKHMSNLYQLRELNLSQCRLITDIGLEHISNHHSQLRLLNLFQCGLITDTGLEYLSNLHYLRELNLNCCKLIQSQYLIQ